MGWLVQTLVKLLLGALSELFGSLAIDFIRIFGVNIGANFSTLEKSRTLDQVLESYPEAQDSLSSVFDKIFPMTEFKTLFVGMALVIATALFAKELVLAITSPLGGRQRQHPLTSVLKYFGAVVGVVLSFRVFIIMEFIMNEFYVKFGTTAINVMNDTSGVENALDNLLQGSASGGAAPGVIADALNMASFFDLSTNVALGIGELILNLMIVWLLFINFIKLMLEILERYIVLGVLFYTSPLAFSTISSEDTRDIFKSWFRMSLSEMLLIVTNSIFIGIFIGALSRMSSLTSSAVEGGFLASVFLASNRLSWMIYMLLLIAWLLFAQRLDSYLNSLGLSTAQTGSSLGAAVIAGVGAAAGIGMAIGGKVMNSAALKNARNNRVLNPKKPISSPLQNLASTYKAGAQGAIDSAKGKIGEMRESNGYQATDKEQAAKARTESIHNRNAVGDYLKQNGYSSIGNAVKRGDELTGPQAQEAAEALAKASGDRQLQRSVASGQDFKLSKDSNGVYGATFSDSKGNPMSMAIGGNQKGFLSAGSVNGVPVGIGGSSEAMETLAGPKDVKMHSQIGAQGMGMGTLAGQATTSDGSSFAAIRKPDGSTFRVHAPGSLDAPNAMPLTDGYSASEVQGEGVSFSSYGKLENLSSQTSKWSSHLESSNLGGLRETFSQPSATLSDSDLGNLVGTLNMSNPWLDEAIIGAKECKWNGNNNTLQFKSTDGAVHQLEFFNPDSTSRNIRNSAGIDLSYSLLETGATDGALNEAIVSQDVFGLEKTVKGLASDLQTMGALGSGESFEICAPMGATSSYAQGHDAAMWEIAESGTGESVIQVTRPELVPALGGTDEGWIYADGYAYRLTDYGYSRYPEYAGYL